MKEVLAGMRAGTPATGPLHVHIDVTNGCNAACVTCWDHSPLLTTPRPDSWKRRRMPWARFEALVDALASFGSVKGVVLSGMGEPLTHPDIYRMIARIRAEGWHITLMTNLVAADAEALAACVPEAVLVGVQGVTPATHAAFHPGWNETHFFRMTALLRQLGRTAARVRHVHVINRDTAPELVEMVRFGKMFAAERVNFKLASLSGGTEVCAVDETQRSWLLQEGIQEARKLAERLGVHTNLDLFARQVDAGGLVTVPIAEVGCWMGYVYTRVTVDEEVLYCCNTNVSVGRLSEASLPELWRGERWQMLRGRLAEGRWFVGCERCGKFEQNVKWAQALAGAA